MPKEHHNDGWQGDDASCRAAGQGDGHVDSFSTHSQRSADDADSLRKNSDQSCFPSLKDEVHNIPPLATSKKLTQKSFKGIYLHNI